MQECILPQSLPVFVPPGFPDDNHSDWGQMDPKATLICISLMARDVGYHILLAVSISSFMISALDYTTYLLDV